MNWKLKALVQNTVSLLPSTTSYAVYYWIQRHFGALRRINPVSRLVAGVETWKRIVEIGHNPTDKIFFEVGTGRVPLTPLAYWLLGARGTISVDLNPYLRPELVRESLLYMTEHDGEILQIFGSYLVRERLDRLREFSCARPFSLDAFLDLCSITYIAPGDAAATGLDRESVDFHTSFTVFEHIPPDVLSRILEEGNRILRTDGLFVHYIDYSDHFSHSDDSISGINFLRYSDVAWDKYASNRYMYMNRLRHDDFERLFRSAGHQLLETDASVDPQCLELLRTETIDLSPRFAEKATEVLAIVGSWVVSTNSCIED